MKIDTFFIVNAVLLVALIAGASYLQKTYDTDKAPHTDTAAASNTVPAVSDTSGGWHISTAAAPATIVTPATGQTQMARAVVKTVPKPAVHRVYNEDDDN